MYLLCPNKSVVIWLKTCQLHLESGWTFLSAYSKTQGTAELLLAVPDLKEKPNFTKLLITSNHCFPGPPRAKPMTPSVRAVCPSEPAAPSPPSLPLPPRRCPPGRCRRRVASPTGRKSRTETRRPEVRRRRRRTLREEQDRLLKVWKRKIGHFSTMWVTPL